MRLLADPCCLALIAVGVIALVVKKTCGDESEA